MTDVPDLVRFGVVAPTDNSVHSSMSAVISIAQAVPNFCAFRKVFQKHLVNWNKVCDAMQDLPWCNIWYADNTVEVLRASDPAGFELCNNRSHPREQQLRIKKGKVFYGQELPSGEPNATVRGANYQLHTVIIATEVT